LYKLSSSFVSISSFSAHVFADKAANLFYIIIIKIFAKAHLTNVDI